MRVKPVTPRLEYALANHGPPERLGTWRRGDESQFELAQAILRALVAAYAARIEAADADTAENLKARQFDYGRQLTELTASDVDRIGMIVASYPALLDRVRRGQDPE